MTWPEETNPFALRHCDLNVFLQRGAGWPRRGTESVHHRDGGLYQAWGSRLWTCVQGPRCSAQNLPWTSLTREGRTLTVAPGTGCSVLRQGPADCWGRPLWTWLPRPRVRLPSEERPPEHRCLFFRQGTWLRDDCGAPVLCAGPIADRNVISGQ